MPNVSNDVDTFLRLADPTATESTEGLVEFATQAEAEQAQAVDAVVRARHLRLRTDANGALSVGDLGGNARGTDAINIQTSRASVDQVASHDNGMAIGVNSKCGSPKSIAIGYSANATATGSGYYNIGESIAIGADATASGFTGRATAIGRSATASGTYSTAIGYGASASGYGGTVVGRYVTASGYNSTAVGDNADAGSQATAIGLLATASGDYDTAVGYNSEASGSLGAIAVGYNSVASGSSSSAIGYHAKTTVADTVEVAYFAGATRSGGIRAHSTGMVALTAQDRDTAYAASAAANGSEVDNELAQGMFAIRFSNASGNNLIIDYNDAGTIRTATLALA